MTGRDKSWHTCNTKVKKPRILIRLKQDTISTPWFQWFEVVLHVDKSSVCVFPFRSRLLSKFQCPLLFKIGTKFGDPSENPLTAKKVYHDVALRPYMCELFWSKTYNNRHTIKICAELFLLKSLIVKFGRRNGTDNTFLPNKEILILTHIFY